MSENESKKYKVLRVTQLDAEQIDYQIVSLLKSFLLDTFKTEPFTFLLKFEPELGACLQLLLWNFSVRKHGSHFGQSMLGTQFVGSDSHPVTGRQKWSFAVYIVLQWVKNRERWVLKLVDFIFKNRVKFNMFIYVQKIFTHLETIVKLMSLMNMLQFMRTSDHVTLFQRIVNLKHVYTSKPYPRYIDYEYMRKQMMWDAISKTIICLIPFVNFRKISYWFKLVLLKVYKKTGNEVERREGETISTVCSICNELATNPCNGLNCRHVYCYYCIETSKVNESFLCGVCGEDITMTMPSEFTDIVE